MIIFCNSACFTVISRNQNKNCRENTNWKDISFSSLEIFLATYLKHRKSHTLVLDGTYIIIVQLAKTASH